jgi:hypothetical protein
MIRLTQARVALVAIAATVAVPLLTAAASAPAGSTIGPPCNSSFDPYAYSRAAVAACGYTTFRLSALKGLAGGGRGYVYDENGTEAEIMVAPRGFDPMTATASQLAEYGFPSRPSGPAGRASWNAEMGHAHPAAAPPFLAETHARSSYTDQYSLNWSGYAAGGSDGKFTEAEAYYYEPSYYPDSCSSSSAVDWAGIGGYYKNSPLGQDGTAFGVPGMAAHQAWWELYPINDIQPVNLTATIGYIVDASVEWIRRGTDTYYAFYVENTRSGAYVALQYHTSSYDGRSAEAITERPTINGSISDLSNYKTMTYHQTYANGSGLNTFSNLYNLTMLDDSGNTMATAGKILSSGNFKDYYQNFCS